MGGLAQRAVRRAKFGHSQPSLSLEAGLILLKTEKVTRPGRAAHGKGPGVGESGRHTSPLDTQGTRHHEKRFTEIRIHHHTDQVGQRWRPYHRRIPLRDVVGGRWSRDWDNWSGGPCLVFHAPLKARFAA